MAAKEDAYVFKEEEEEDFEPSFRSLKKGRRKTHALKETQCSQEKRRVKHGVHSNEEERRLGSEERRKVSDKQATEEKSPGDKNEKGEAPKTGAEDQVKVSEHGGSSDSKVEVEKSERIEEKPAESKKTVAPKEDPSPPQNKKVEGEDSQATAKGLCTFQTYIYFGPQHAWHRKGGNQDYFLLD